MERRKLGLSFKLQAVNVIQERGMTVALAARYMGRCCRRWAKEERMPQGFKAEDRWRLRRRTRPTSS